ncbi:MAG: type II toxin-antitoxin system RatA family toxin [Wenzhouxiangellaceae bacterium]|jgi:ribosome-associated toxin RatA of RatAB toxin-antitoxin module|nr:type II toxin-antitoxin system RatA family toxin [Wenzhouxiangellaceae bacterium]MBS3747195.1 type II toxin-antitoxin system RatA family toxin [Wenzhouxiangellaceae bacterium]MBS3823373.1 type II toxin-antitoxin system RatA family toxin [Wenzhouxiangellaceae bacterium]
MPEIQRSALVSYTPMQMFDLVRDVERYPEFLSWVVDAECYEETRDYQHASLEVSVAGVNRRIVTRNDLIPGELLRLNLAEGPFRQFSGEWHFSDLGIGSRVQLSLGFEFDNPVLVAAFSRGFVSVANRMVDDFCRRADTLYAGR